MSEATSVQDAEVVPPAKAEAPKPGPAQDLRAIQALIVNGIFPGNVAPQVVKAFELLEHMAQQVEREASKGTNEKVS